MEIGQVLEKDVEIKKIYYSSSEVAGFLEEKIATIRNWENYFGVPKPLRNRCNYKRYTIQDIEQLKYIKHLIREEKYSMEGAKEKLKKEKE